MGRQHVGRRTRSRGREAAPTPLVLRLARVLGVTTARRAGVLALVICALVLSVAVPLRNYLQMQGRLDSLHAQQAALEHRVTQLEHRRALLNSRAYTEVAARERLRYVYPGRTPYIVELPEPPSAPAPDPAERGPVQPWYSRLWSSVSGTG